MVKSGHLSVEAARGTLPCRKISAQVLQCRLPLGDSVPIEDSPPLLSLEVIYSLSPPTVRAFGVLFCVRVFLSHTCHSGTDFVLTLLVHDVIL